MKRIALLAAAFLALTAGGALAQNVTGRGVVYTTSATAATAAGTTEQTLATWALPAGALDAAGRRLRITVAFSTAANVDSKTAKLYFGSESIATPAMTTSGETAYLQLDVVKSGSSTQIVWGKGVAATTPIAVYAAAGAETDTSPIVIKATCTDGTSSAGDCVLQDFVVEKLN